MIKSLLLQLRTKCVYKHHYLQMFGHVGIFHPLEAVGRGSEPQLQVSEKLNEII